MQSPSTAQHTEYEALRVAVHQRCTMKASAAVADSLMHLLSCRLRPLALLRHVWRR
jgi:hypothetical protein